MCNSGNSALFNAVFMFAGAIISGIIGWVSAIAIFKKQRYADAVDQFKSVFKETYIFIEEIIPNRYIPPSKNNPAGSYILGKGQNISSAVINERPKHKRAIILFSFHANNKRMKNIKKAYDNYYNPLGKTGSLKTIDKLSFGIYNFSEYDIEKSILNRRISGKNLALENIRKIIKAAQE